MRRFAFWLFPIIALAIAVFVVFFLIEINPSAPKVEGGEESNSLNFFDTSSETRSGWIDRFSFSREDEYLYPVNEVTVVVDTDTKTEGSAARYRLRVPVRDSYELFCLRQELKQSDLPYLLDKQGEKMNVYVDSQDQNRLLGLVTKLKTYQISATVAPLNEE